MGNELINGYMWINWYMLNVSSKEVLENVYGCKFRDEDPYYIEKRKLFDTDKFVWFCALDQICQSRLSVLAYEKYGK